MGMISKYAAQARIEKFACDAASEYLEKDAQLNETIKKLATDNSLSTEEINRVCEESNQKVYASLFSKLADKNFSFPLADSKEVIFVLNKEASTKPTPSVSYKVVDVAYNDPAEKVASVADSIIEEGVEIPEATTKEQMSVYLEKLGSIERKLKDNLGEASIKKESAVSEFLHDTKQIILRDEASLHELYHNLVDTRPEHSHKIAMLLKTAALQMGKKFELAEFAKESAVGVDPKMLKDGLSFSGRPLKIVNGRQALVMSLDALIEQSDAEDKLQEGLSLTGDRVKYLRKKLNNKVSEEYLRDY